MLLLALLLAMRDEAVLAVCVECRGAGVENNSAQIPYPAFPPLRAACLPAGTALAGILAVLVAGGLDMKATLAGKQHYLLYCLTPAMKPRMLMTGACAGWVGLPGWRWLPAWLAMCPPAWLHGCLLHPCTLACRVPAGPHRTCNPCIHPEAGSNAPPGRDAQIYLILSETAVPPPWPPAPAGARRAGKQRRVDTRELSLAPPCCSTHPAPIPAPSHPMRSCCLSRHPAPPPRLLPSLPASPHHLTPPHPAPTHNHCRSG